jgi:deferrochelatase/peroxidase EfeB
VFRQLEQDVRGFWRFLDQQANSDPEQRRKLGEAMVGRTMLGQPLVPLASCPIPGVGPKTEETSQNQFTYESDKTGVNCPFGAHVRRANPRKPTCRRPAGLSPDYTNLRFQTTAFAMTRRRQRDFPILLRRGREYGSGAPQRSRSISPTARSEESISFA